MKDYSLDRIKLIIWDLDDTFWTGTLSEQNISPIQKNIDFVHKLNDYGYANSICSKNDYENTVSKLRELAVVDEFVFKSIDWTPKGPRVKELISSMNLRPANVLFIDDNHLNLEEVKFYCPEIMTAFPEIIDKLIEQLNNASQPKTIRKRYNQYRLLEEKVLEQKKATSAEEFLAQCDIKIKFYTDCTRHFDRVYELIQRTNQLNFTKVRSDESEIQSLLTDNSISCGLVEVHDKYGDYGIVGFYAIKDEQLLHFAFSCRTLGMGIEQYVYAKLGYPKLEVVGEVASTLQNDMIPSYITEVKDVIKREQRSTLGEKKILFKGPCDLEQIFAYIQSNDNIKTEFTYESKVIGTVQQYNHTITILDSLDKAERNDPFTEGDMYNTSLFTEKWDYVFLSIIPDTGLGVYENKANGRRIVFGDYMFSLVDCDNWGKFISKELYTANNTFDLHFLKNFSEGYSYIGLISPDDFAENLEKIRENLPEMTKLIFINGCELEYKSNTNIAYDGRWDIHKVYNRILENICKSYDNTIILDVNKYVTSQDDFSNSPNHFRRKVYYDIAQEVIEIINEGNSGFAREKYSKAIVKDYFNRIVRKVKKMTGR